MTTNGIHHLGVVGTVAAGSSIVPTIKTIFPNEGWCQGGLTAIIIGEGFHDGLQFTFGSTAVFGEMITPQAIKVTIPPRSSPGTVDVCVSAKGKSLNRTNSYRFTYVSLTEPSIDYGFQRLQKLLPKYPNDPDRLPKDVILRRAADLAEALYSRTADPSLTYATAAYSQFESELVADYARNHASPHRSLTGSYSHGALYQPPGAYSSTGSNLQTAANFLNSSLGTSAASFSPFGAVNPFTLQSLHPQKPGAY